MKILALIPARGDSKRLPGKNKMLLGGKPLIKWSIDSSLGIDLICDVLVSTDDSVLAEIAKQSGAMVPWLRPETLATDTATSIEVAMHALEWYQKNKGAVDALLLLQPTSPFRTESTIRKGIDLFIKNNMQAVIGVSPVSEHPMWCMQIRDGMLMPLMEQNGFESRSQDLPPAYIINGCFYLVKTEDFIVNHSFVTTGSIPLIIDSPQEALDIDTQWDWDLATWMLLNNKNKV